MEPWRDEFRNGIAPQFEERLLIALRDGLRRNDLDIVQGETTIPKFSGITKDWPCTGGCAIGYMIWQKNKDIPIAAKTGYVAAFFEMVLDKAHEVMRCNCLSFLNWFDFQPREKVFPELADEIDTILEQRKDSKHATNGNESQALDRGSEKAS